MHFIFFFYSFSLLMSFEVARQIFECASPNLKRAYYAKNDVAYSRKRKKFPVQSSKLTPVSCKSKAIPTEGMILHSLLFFSRKERR